MKNKTTYLWKDGICVKSVLEHNSVLVVTTEFDEQGNLIRTMTDYDENQNSAGLPDAEEVYEYIYDSRGCIQEGTVYYRMSDGEQAAEAEAKIEMEYDKDGNLVQKTTRMGDSCLIEKFEYDKKEI